MPSRALVSRRFGRGGWARAPRRACMWSSSVRDRPLGSVVVGTVLVVGAFMVGQSAEHVEVPVEVDVDLAAVVAGHLDLVVALFVTDLGVDHAALARGALCPDLAAVGGCDLARDGEPQTRAAVRP